MNFLKLWFVTEKALEKDSLKLKKGFVFKAIELYILWFLTEICRI